MPSQGRGFVTAGTHRRRSALGPPLTIWLNLALPLCPARISSGPCLGVHPSRLLVAQQCLPSLLAMILLHDLAHILITLMRCSSTCKPPTGRSKLCFWEVGGINGAAIARQAFGPVRPQP
jgi:hypothetical protein